MMEWPSSCDLYFASESETGEKMDRRSLSAYICKKETRKAYKRSYRIGASISETRKMAPGGLLCGEPVLCLKPLLLSSTSGRPPV